MKAYLSSNPPPLFHYCTVDSFYKIISTGTLWMSSYRYFRDSMEVSYIKRYFDKLLLEVSATDLIILKGWLNKFQNDSLDIFITCLTSDPDSLSQWRGYTNDAEGVAIQINPSAFDLTNPPPSKGIANDGIATIFLDKVGYKEEYQFKRLKDLAIKYLDKAHGSKNKDDSDRIEEGFIEDLYKLALISKNRAFHEEKEWRIYQFVKEIPIHAYDERSEFGFVNHRGSIKPYFKLQLDKDSVLKAYGKDEYPIKGIVLGPRTRLDIKSVYDFLRINGYNEASKNISKSIATYL